MRIEQGRLIDLTDLLDFRIRLHFLVQCFADDLSRNIADFPS
ncbi:hypothetical protein D1BOALGB6SA_8523 [Olavius sp. associated proteobacterium Delta 1]|nr:hypothetical protein D1BOALGB6SA_8523 [Olavius sp. associated proteobacterium Delta 1]